MDTIITRDVSIPRFGFGTFRMPGGGCQPVVESALALGYRHLDTAAMYETRTLSALRSPPCRRTSATSRRPSRPTGTRGRFSSRTHPTFRRYACTQ